MNKQKLHTLNMDIKHNQVNNVHEFPGNTLKIV